jgi:diacylglycerol kinase family enzyme
MEHAGTTMRNTSEVTRVAPESASVRAPAAQLTREMPLYIVMNATSGSRDPEASRETIADVLTSYGQRYEFILIERPAEIAAVARRVLELLQRDAGAVAVAAGDGTINAVAHAVMPLRRPFGIIPKGTFNFMARDHGIPVDLEQATRTLIEGRATPVQVGALNDRIFLVNASLGLHPQLLKDREEATRKFGRHQSVAFWAGMKTLFREHREFVIRIAHDREEQIVRTPSVFVGNNAIQMERVDEELADALEQWRLAAVLMHPVSSFELFLLALRGAVGKLGDAEHVTAFDFRQMFVSPLTVSCAG